MKYNLIVAPAAQQDIEDVFDYYLNIRFDLAERFIATLSTLYQKLEKEPHNYSYFGNQKTIPAVSLVTFPYLIVFQIKDDHVYIFG